MLQPSLSGVHCRQNDHNDYPEHQTMAKEIHFGCLHPTTKCQKKQDTLRPTFVTKTHQTHNASIAVTNVSRDGCSLGVPVSSNRKTTTSSSVLSGSDVARPSWFRRNTGTGIFGRSHGMCIGRADEGDTGARAAQILKALRARRRQ